MTDTNKSRQPIYDNLRGIAMVGICLIHIHSYFQFFLPLESFVVGTRFISNLSRFGVPVFIFTSVLFLSMKPSKEFFLPKLQNLILPYCFASLVGYFVKYWSFSEFGFSDFLERLVLGTVFVPYYFVPLLFQYYVVFYLGSLVLERFPNRKEPWGRSLLLATGLITTAWGNQGGFGFLPSWFSPIWIGSFLLVFSFGIWARPWRKTEPLFVSYLNRFWVSLVLVIVFVFFMIENAQDSLAGTEWRNHELLYPVVAFGILYSVWNRWNSLQLPLLELIGKNSLSVFLIHPLVIHLCHSLSPRDFALGIPGMGGLVVAYFVVLGLNLALPLWLGGVVSFFFQKLRSRIWDH